MQLGMLGLGRMGANIVRRLMRAGHSCVVYDLNASAVDQMVHEGASGSVSLESFVKALTPPRARRYRMFVLVPAVWALRSIEAARRTPEFPWGPERPKLSRGELWTSGAQAFLGLGPVDELRRCAPAIESPAPATA